MHFGAGIMSCLENFSCLYVTWVDIVSHSGTNIATLLLSLCNLTGNQSWIFSCLYVTWLDTNLEIFCLYVTWQDTNAEIFPVFMKLNWTPILIFSPKLMSGIIIYSYIWMIVRERIVWISGFQHQLALFWIWLSNFHTETWVIWTTSLGNMQVTLKWNRMLA